MDYHGLLWSCISNWASRPRLNPHLQVGGFPCFFDTEADFFVIFDDLWWFAVHVSEWSWVDRWFPKRETSQEDHRSGGHTFWKTLENPYHILSHVTAYQTIFAARITACRFLTAGSTLAHRSAAQRSPPCLPKLRRLTWPRLGKIFKLTWSFLVNSAPRINGNRVKKMVFQAVNHFGWDLLGISWLFKE